MHVRKAVAQPFRAHRARPPPPARSAAARRRGRRRAAAIRSAVPPPAVPAPERRRQRRERRRRGRAVIARSAAVAPHRHPREERIGPEMDHPRARPGPLACTRSMAPRCRARPPRRLPPSAGPARSREASDASRGQNVAHRERLADRQPRAARRVQPARAPTAARRIAALAEDQRRARASSSQLRQQRQWPPGPARPGSPAPGRPGSASASGHSAPSAARAAGSGRPDPPARPARSPSARADQRLALLGVAHLVVELDRRPARSRPGRTSPARTGSASPALPCAPLGDRRAARHDEHGHVVARRVDDPHRRRSRDPTFTCTITACGRPVTSQ